MRDEEKRDKRSSLFVFRMRDEEKRDKCSSLFVFRMSDKEKKFWKIDWKKI
jgi:hypothetical protein